MELGENAGGYFPKEEIFDRQISEKALEFVVESYKRNSRLLRLQEKIAIKSMCPNDLAEAKITEIKQQSLEYFLRLLSHSSKDYDENDFFDYFCEKKESLSAIIKDKIRE